MTGTDHASRPEKVSPIYVIAGFLGSGKTTLLKRLLAHQLDRGVKPAVLMNEFGEVDVDGALLHEHPCSKDVELQALLSGCICCDLSGEFSETVGHLVRKSNGAPVFIETTGLADTGQVVMGVEKALTRSTSTTRGVLASVIVMVDGPRFLTLGAYWSAADDHLKQADVVVINKLDQIDRRQADLVERRIKVVNPAATIVRAAHAEVDVDRLFGGAATKKAPSIEQGTVKDSATGYQSGSFKILKPFDPVRLEAWLKRFERSVIRMKGFVNVQGRTGLQELQWIMGSLMLTPYTGSQQSQAKLVVIGRRVPWQRFLDGLEACLVRPARRRKRQTTRWSSSTRRRTS
ncbi:MAG: GTP-binding protein [Nitrospira sp.]|nr:GTP-binding protein [Nitrospira sp.]